MTLLEFKMTSLDLTLLRKVSIHEKIVEKNLTSESLLEKKFTLIIDFFAIIYWDHSEVNIHENVILGGGVT